MIVLNNDNPTIITHITEQERSELGEALKTLCEPQEIDPRYGETDEEFLERIRG